MSRRAEITAQTRRNLIDAFWGLYRERGLEKITAKDIAAKAGYNRGTFYEYFRDVYDVLEQVENSLIPTLDQIPPVSTPTGSAGMPLGLFYELYERNKKYYSALLGARGDPAFAGRLKESLKPMMMQMFAQRPGVDPVELEYVLEYTLSAMIGIMSFWSRQTGGLSSAELHGLIDRLMTQGVTRQLPM